MINALTAYNMTMEAIKFNENIWNIIEKKIVAATECCSRFCKYDVYPDSPVSVEVIIAKLNDTGFKVDVDICEEWELEFEADSCTILTIRW